MPTRTESRASENGVGRLSLRIEGQGAEAVELRARLERIARDGLGEKLDVLLAAQAPHLLDAVVGRVRAPLEFDVGGLDDEAVGWLWAQRVVDRVAGSPSRHERLRPPESEAREDVPMPGPRNVPEARRVDAAAVRRSALRVLSRTDRAALTNGVGGGPAPTARWSHEFLASLARAPWFAEGRRPTTRELELALGVAPGSSPPPRGDALEAWLQAASAQAVGSGADRAASGRGSDAGPEQAWTREVLEAFLDEPWNLGEPSAAEGGLPGEDPERSGRRVSALLETLAGLPPELLPSAIGSCLREVEALRSELPDGDGEGELVDGSSGAGPLERALEELWERGVGGPARDHASEAPAESEELVAALAAWFDACSQEDSNVVAAAGRRVSDSFAALADRFADRLAKPAAEWPAWLAPRASTALLDLRGRAPDAEEIAALLRLPGGARSASTGAEFLRALERLEPRRAEAASPPERSDDPRAERLVAALGACFDALPSARSTHVASSRRLGEALSALADSGQDWPAWLAPRAVDAPWVTQRRTPDAAELRALLRMPAEARPVSTGADLVRAIRAASGEESSPGIGMELDALVAALAECFDAQCFDGGSLAASGRRLAEALVELARSEERWPLWLDPRATDAPWVAQRRAPDAAELRTSLRLPAGAPGVSTGVSTGAELLRAIRALSPGKDSSSFGPKVETLLAALRDGFEFASRTSTTEPGASGLELAERLVELAASDREWPAWLDRGATDAPWVAQHRAPDAGELRALLRLPAEVLPVSTGGELLRSIRALSAAETSSASETTLDPLAVALAACFDAVASDPEAGGSTSRADSGRRLAEALAGLAGSAEAWPEWLDPRAAAAPWIAQRRAPDVAELRTLLRLPAGARGVSTGVSTGAEFLRAIDVPAGADSPSTHALVGAWAAHLDELSSAASPLADPGRRLAEALTELAASSPPVWPTWLDPRAAEARWVVERRAPDATELGALLRLAPGALRVSTRAELLAAIGRVEDRTTMGATDGASDGAETASDLELALLIELALQEPVAPTKEPAMTVGARAAERLAERLAERAATGRELPTWLDVRGAVWVKEARPPTAREVAALLTAVRSETGERRVEDASAVVCAPLWTNRSPTSTGARAAGTREDLLRTLEQALWPARAAERWVSTVRPAGFDADGWIATRAAGLALLRPFLSPACDDLFDALGTPADEAARRLHRRWLLSCACNLEAPDGWHDDAMVRLLAGIPPENKDSEDEDGLPAGSLDSSTPGIPAPRPEQAEVLGRVATGLLRSLAAVVPGLGTHGETMLQGYFVLRAGRIGPPAPTGRRLQLLRGELDMLLEHSELPMGLGHLSWVGLLDVEIVSAWEG